MAGGNTVVKVDLKRELKRLYSAPAGVPGMVEVPPLRFLMVDGRGDPNDNTDFHAAMEALYGMAYTLKFMLKRGPSTLDWVVMPLQGLWWADDMEVFRMDARADWKWTLMILQPDDVTEEHVEMAREELRAKKDPPGLAGLRYETYTEGLSAQVMHVGPYSEEGPTIARLHAFIDEQGRRPRGKHHEIYMGDPRRTAPERLRTILRQPVE
jgi:hypothetical protein